MSVGLSSFFKFWPLSLVALPVSLADSSSVIVAASVSSNGDGGGDDKIAAVGLGGGVSGGDQLRVSAVAGWSTRGTPSSSSSCSLSLRRARILAALAESVPRFKESKTATDAAERLMATEARGMATNAAMVALQMRIVVGG